MTSARHRRGSAIPNILAPSVLSLGLGCGPQAHDEPEPPGTLEYEHDYARIYRQGRRIDIVLVEGETERRECGVLTERAYTELEETAAALEPS